MTANTLLALLLLAAFGGVIMAAIIAAFTALVIAKRMFSQGWYAYGVLAFVGGLLWAAVIIYGAGVIASVFASLGGGGI